MSNEGSVSQSQSTSSDSSSQLSFFQDNIIDLALLDNSSFTRSGTVVRRATIPFRKERMESSSTEDDETTSAIEKYRKEPQYRHSLSAISERRSRRNLLSNESGKNMHRHSTESPDCVRKTISDCKEEKFDHSSTSNSYLSWIESVNSDYFGSTISNVPAQDVESKVGEWNNFWLNYSNASLRRLSTELTFSSDGANQSVDESEERKSPESTQKDGTDKNSTECVMLTMEELQETLRCSQRIVDIMQNAMKRSEIDEISNESYYSQQISLKNSILDDMPSARERSISCIDSHTLQRQKQVDSSQQQSSSTSCIEAILNTGVADIFKKVMSKRREAAASESEATISFPEWTGR
ncbi:unnamed protein product [Ceutorhynchus assimilis]|uniref:Uncharacterized protein n=1 Tax=Ceutorhynchus assimilis TaxID=467358 RepID=A0A9N9MM35_9CUCU|nr:unnamed protein product [Ceutorhynchus assimilis]